jgi:AAA+ superfamily predicted ATPase
MQHSNVKDLLNSYVDALRPIIYINHFDFHFTDELIKSLNINVEILEYNNAGYDLNFTTKTKLHDLKLENFLDTIISFPQGKNVYVILKDVNSLIKNPSIIARLKTISEKTIYDDSFTATIFIISSILEIPVELENYVTVVDLPTPNQSEITNIINNYAKDLGLSVKEDQINELALDLIGLSVFQIEQVLNLAYQKSGTIDESDRELILFEKEQTIRKSGQLEILNYKESIDDIGGLEKLKDWLKKKSIVFGKLDKAIKFGVDIPKGILILGMPGCGKSLTAKAAARLFKVSLLRLDVGRLLGKYLGESENNMRQALRIAEQMSPCVLWIDEIEKAFAGVGDKNNSGEVATRLFGFFLTWLQEKESSVFIIATANDITKLPIEFLRKGRFDELFFVDLPNPEERRKIFQIHLKKRKKWHKEIDTVKLVQETNGYSGADIEAVIKESVENSFIANKEQISTEDILKVIKETKSISKTLGDKIDNARKEFSKLNIKPASLNKE